MTAVITDLMLLEQKARKQLRKAERERRRSIESFVGLKCWFIPRTDILTAYAVKERCRRRAARKVAHESRRRNR